MMSNPRKGALAQVWYNKRLAPEMPLHGKIGVVKIASKGKPRNHGIEIDGVMWVVPCGNLRPPGGHRRPDEFSRQEQALVEALAWHSTAAA